MKKLLPLFLIPLALFGAAGDIKISYKSSNDISWIDAIFAKQNNVILGLGSAGVPQVATQAGAFTWTGLQTISANATSLPSPLSGTILHVAQVDATNTRATFDGFGASPVIELRRSQGTNASKSAVTSGIFLGSLSASGYETSQYSSSRAALNFVTAETWTNSAQGLNIEFRTTPIGATSSALAYTFASTGLTFERTGQRILGDFTTTTFANRVMFQTSTANSTTNVGVIPSGSAATAVFQAWNNSDPTNAGAIAIASTGGSALISSGHSGSGTTVKLDLAIDNIPKLTIGTDGSTTAFGLLSVNQATLTNPSVIAGTNFHITAPDSTSAIILLDTFNVNPAIIGRASAGTSAAPTATQSGAGLLIIGGRGYGATGYAASSTAAINLTANQNFTDSAMGTNIRFETTPDGSTTRATALTIGADKSLTLAGTLIVPTSTPASAAAAGVAGTITWDSSYIYVAVGTNQWKRAALSSW